MSALRQRMLQDMQLRGLAPKTQKNYVEGVRALVKYCGISPEKITEEQIRQYFLYLHQEKHAAPGTFRIHYYGIRFLFQTTLRRPWPAFKIIRPKKRKKLPVVLSTAEVRELLARIQRPNIRMCLTTIYSCGLRLSEGARLQVSDVDSQRMLLAVRNGKGGKDRYVPLAQRTLELLRLYWKTERPAHPWLFPSRSGDTQLSHGVIQKAFKAALRESGIQKNASVHTLRHSYATHLRENKVELQVIQQNLGHKSPETTAIYAHLTPPVMNAFQTTINQLMANL